MRFAVAVSVLTALMIMAGDAWVALESGSPRSAGARLQARGHTDALRVETFTLDNGIQVIILLTPRSSKLTYMVWYKVGAADDPAGKSGLAHLLEHATFRGVGAHPEQEPARSFPPPGESEPLLPISQHHKRKRVRALSACRTAGASDPML